MKIDRIEVYSYDLSYRYGKYVMSGNQVINSIPSTVVRILTDSGIEGWGEVCPLGPLYLASPLQESLRNTHSQKLIDQYQISLEKHPAIFVVSSLNFHLRNLIYYPQNKNKVFGLLDIS